MRGKSTAEEKHAHDDQDGEKLQPDAPAHQRLREIGIAAARHIRDPGEQNEEHCAERHRNKNIAPTYTVHRIGSWSAFVIASSALLGLLRLARNDRPSIRIE